MGSVNLSGVFRKMYNTIKQKLIKAGFTKLQKNARNKEFSKKQIFERESLKLQKTFYLCNAFLKTGTQRRAKPFKIKGFNPIFAGMAKLVDAPDLGSGAARHGGSSPSTRTINDKTFKGAKLLIAPRGILVEKLKS